MSSFLRRELREDDADVVAGLFVEGHGEARRMNGAEIREWLANESLLHENLIVLERDGTAVAYYDLWLEPDGTCDIDAAAPGLWDEAYADAETVARERGAQRVRTYIPEHGAAAEVVRDRGYEIVRSSWTMGIDLGVEAPREAALPEGVEIRPYRHPEDEQATFDTQEAAFADHWGFHEQPIEQWRGFTVNASNFDPTLWLLAWAGDEVIGCSQNYFERPGDPGYGLVGTLAVRREWRRRGVGEALLRRSFAALHARGRREIRLNVDSENTTGATRLYERVGMSVVHRANTWEHLL
jgi:ribosomal protein S18 acetylase RimI-like enzyme